MYARINIAIKTIFDIQFPKLALTVMMDKLASKHSHPWVFMALAFGVSWLFWIPAGLLGQGADTFPVTLPFWLFMMAMIPESILMTWIYNNNRRSTLSAVLFHPVINISGELIEVSERAESLQVSLLIVNPITVIIVWGPKTLTHRLENTRLKDQLI